VRIGCVAWAGDGRRGRRTKRPTGAKRVRSRKAQIQSLVRLPHLRIPKLVLVGNTSGGAIVSQSDHAGSLARGGRLRLFFHNLQIGLGRGRELLLLRRFGLLLLLLPIALARFAILCHAVDVVGVVPVLVAGACIKNGRWEYRPRSGTTRLTFRGV
jgi:hypothetical protein